MPFEANHEESVLEGWLESNPGGILEDGPLLIIGRQVPTDLGKSIDLLGVDREGNVVSLSSRVGEGGCLKKPARPMPGARVFERQGMAW